MANIEIGAGGGAAAKIQERLPENIAGNLSPSVDVPAFVFHFHTAFGGGVRWRLGRRGLEIENSGVERTRGAPTTVKRVWDDFGGSIERWAGHYGVPAELILATICTESDGRPDRVRLEPGYLSDDRTPDKISPGLMQTLISTAGWMMENENIDETIGRSWLLEPDNSIRVGAAYIAHQKEKTDFDPPRVACAYNAGSVIKQTGGANRWKMRQYPIGTPEHADRFVKWFNDFFSLLVSGEIQTSAGYFT
jgi:hypothetical protein